jgi:hypothetical protein
MNRLANEQSPYLLQHKDNPVDWFPWGDEAFRKAQAEDKPIFLSIGYSTCHWCHVMEGDSFEDKDVAKALNADFVSIKVDREERPDLDAIYMKAVQAMNQHGGWPLSVILTPDRQPFWGGTFLPKAQFLHLLSLIRKAWHEDRDRIFQSSSELTRHLASQNRSSRHTEVFDESTLRFFCRQQLDRFDAEYGGFGPAPKFPPAQSLLAMLRLNGRLKGQPLTVPIRKTLDVMAKSGLHDHVGGGFHRYATDRQWQTPHFEKMLYDNALLLMAYTEAYQAFDEPVYRDIIDTTIDYLQTCLRHREGGFYSAEDADSERTEGKYYVWTQAELNEQLTTNERDILNRYFHISEQGNFHIDHRVEALEAAAGLAAVKNANTLHAAPHAPFPSRYDSELGPVLQRLAELRAKRVRPQLDDKILTSWNGLTIAALAKAYRAVQNPHYLHLAEEAMTFVEQHLIHTQERHLWRTYRQGQVKYRAYLTDYAALVMASLELYQASFNPHWLEQAQTLQTWQNDLFWDAEQGCFFEADGLDPSLIFRAQEFIDGALPAGNSLSTLNLYHLGRLLQDQKLTTMGDRILSANWQRLQRYPSAFPWQILALDNRLDESTDMVMTGSIPKQVIQTVQQSFQPQLLTLHWNAKLTETTSLARYEPGEQSKARYYVCRYGSCDAPTTDWPEAWEHCQRRKPLTLS